MMNLDIHPDDCYGVLGMGRSGLAVARAIKASGGNVICWDDNPAGRDKALGEGFDVADLMTAEIDMLVMSPGIPHFYPEPHPIAATAMARGVAIDNDIGLYISAFDLDNRVIAITGSNGKSTTAALLHHCLEGSLLGGNIGRAVLIFLHQNLINM